GPLITTAARALAAGDPLGALKRVAVRPPTSWWSRGSRCAPPDTARAALARAEGAAGQGEAARDTDQLHVRGPPGLIQGARKSRIAAAISSACVSSAKWPVSKKRMTAPGTSRLNASAPAGRKKGSFLPHTARNGGLCVRK